MPARNRLVRKYIFHKILAVLLLFIVVVSAAIIHFVTSAEELLNDVEVEKNSDLTYYLHVKYDGVDVFGVESSDTQMANVLSDRIKVTDTLPKGLTFRQFITSSDGTFGAVSRDVEQISCAGHVVDDTQETDDITTYTGTWNGSEFYYHGLHYDNTTREVSFYVERLKAGCELTIGIVTKTPATVDDPETTEVEHRRDFYNTANATEGLINARSNTVHVFMGDLTAVEHNVTYAYIRNPSDPTAPIPDNAPALPGSQSYIEGASVSVAAEPMLDGYTFSGWTSSTTGCDGTSFTEVTPVNQQFDMPTSGVCFVGSWEQSAVAKYRVIYEVAAAQDSDLPSWAVAPKTKEYEPGTEVSVDSTQAKDSSNNYINYDGYRFSGWKMKDTVTNTVFPITGDDAGVGFVMPAEDVYIIGYYERIGYTVSYQFEGVIIPDNADSLLPAAAKYYPGDRVYTADNPVADGYRFLGWYKSDSFIMPEADVVILGEWGILSGTFAPTITKSVIGTETSYIFGDTVKFETTVCNKASYPLHDVILQEQLDGATFISDGAYYSMPDSPNVLMTDNDLTLPTGTIAQISSLAANTCASIYSTYVVNTVEETTITNTVEMIGALADNNNLLDTTKDYIATTDFDVDEYTEPGPFTGVTFRNIALFAGLTVLAMTGVVVIMLNRKKAHR